LLGDITGGFGLSAASASFAKSPSIIRAAGQRIRGWRMVGMQRVQGAVNREEFHVRTAAAISGSLSPNSKPTPKRRPALRITNAIKALGLLRAFGLRRKSVQTTPKRPSALASRRRVLGLKRGAACARAAAGAIARARFCVERVGGVAERSKAHAWKVCIRETVSRVRIPPPPPT
jgi:hypothetical protein